MNNNLNPSVITDTKGMTSIEIAEVTGREHKNVLRDIRNILSQGVGRLNFELAKYQDKQGKPRDMYQLTPKGCLILASGYDAVLREKIIDRLEVLEKQTTPQVPQTFAEALMLAAEQQQQIERQQKLIADQAKDIEDYDYELNAAHEDLQAAFGEIGALAGEMKSMMPKVSYLDRILECKDTVSVTAIAQDYGMTAKAFNNLLHERGIQHRVGSQWILYAKHLSQGYVQSKTFTYERCDGSTAARTYVSWTQKGRLFIYETLKKCGIMPLIEAQTGKEAHHE